MESFKQQFSAFTETIGKGSRLRMAPTPSGFLHAGNAFNFILNWLAARGGGGGMTSFSASLFLRIDDLDADRKRPDYVQDVFDTLQWLQLDFDQDPVFQSDPQRMILYETILSRLRERNLLYACRKSRRELEPFGGQYPEAFRKQGLALDQPDVAWRIITPASFPMPDFVVRRRDGIPAYQIASLADDLEMGITHLIRGADLETSTRAQQYLAQCLGEKSFEKIRFLHHPLLTGPDGLKLSKSAGSSSLKALREEQATPESIFQEVGAILDLQANSAPTLINAFQSGFH
jgi:glutamyl-tRNA synthetase